MRSTKKATKLNGKRNFQSKTNAEQKNSEKMTRVFPGRFTL